MYKKYSVLFWAVFVLPVFLGAASAQAVDTVDQKTPSVTTQQALTLAPIARVEPANWWVGMQHNRVQVLVYGERIGEFNVSLKYPRVKISNITRVKNPNYLFVTLDIGERAKPGSVDLIFSNKHTQLTHSFTLLAREKNSAKRIGFSAKDTVLLITPDRFVNGNPDNDVIAGMLEAPNPTYKGGRHGGDIAGMLQGLDYIAAMGYTQIWPNPLTENNMKTYSYHGYAATDFYRIDPRFGSNEEFKHFVAEANKRGIGVIQDIILNHIGSNHWWMKDLPTDDWLNFPSHYQETTHMRTVIQDPYAAQVDKEEFVGGWFVPTMPDLNQRNPLLATYLIQNSIWWAEYANLSGIREDTYGYADANFLSAWGKAVMAEYPNFSIVGEEWSNNPALVAHWQKGKINPSGHESYTNSMMDFPIHDALREALVEPEGFDTGFVKLYQALANDFLYPDPSYLMVFPENHDTSRIYSFLNEDQSLNKMAWIYMATIRGIPQFYYGAEVLMTSPRERDDGAVRANMPGGFVGDVKNIFTGKGLTPDELSTQAFVKQLLNWRKSNPVIHQGKLMHYAPKNNMYVYFRYLDDRAVMVVLNKNNQKTQLDWSRFSEVIKDKTNAQNALTGEAISLRSPINLAPLQSLIIDLQ